MCPYETWERGFYLFCEAQRCAWIREPLNTFSNLGFLLAGLIILRRHGRVPQVRVIGIAALLVGILSGFYHATSSRVGESLDLGSMYLLVAGLFCFNLQRLQLVSVVASEWLAVALAGAGVVLLLYLGGSGRMIFDSFILATWATELLIYLKARRAGVISFSYRYFWLALACHGTAFLFWGLDRERILCFPQSLWFQGHAVWHLLGALTFLCLARFYGQFHRRF